MRTIVGQVMNTAKTVASAKISERLLLWCIATLCLLIPQSQCSTSALLPVLSQKDPWSTTTTTTTSTTSCLFMYDGRGWDNDNYLDALSGSEDDRKEANDSYEEYKATREVYDEQRQQQFMQSSDAAQNFMQRRMMHLRQQDPSMGGGDEGMMFDDMPPESSGGGTRFAQMMNQSKRMQQQRRMMDGNADDDIMEQ